MGSHVYRDTAGFYDTLRPTQIIPGWPYDPVRDTEYDPAAPPAWGKPSCKAWWEDGTLGLRAKLIDEADATAAGFSGLVVAVAPSLASDQQHDAVVRTVLNNAPPSWSSNRLVAGNTANTGWLATAENMVKGGLAAGGVTHRLGVLLGHHDGGAASAAHGPGVAPARHLRLVADDGRIVPLHAVDDGGRGDGHLHRQVLERALVPGPVGGRNLIQSMYPDVNVFLQIFANPGEHDAKRMLLNMITTSLYLGLPLLWSGMMAWAGMNVGRSIEAATNPLRNPAQDAGQRGGAIGKGIAMKGRAQVT